MSAAKVTPLTRHKLTGSERQRPHVALIIETSLASGSRYSTPPRALRVRVRAAGAES